MGDGVKAHGVSIVITGHHQTRSFSKNYTTVQDDTKLIDVGENEVIVVTRISVMVSKAVTAEEVSASVGVGAAATPSDEGVCLSHPGIAAGSGAVEGNGGGIIAMGDPGDDLYADCSVPTGGSIQISGSYYILPKE